MQTLAVEPAEPVLEVRPADRLLHIHKWVGIAECIIALLIALLALALHLRFVSHVGGLWRDEANSVHLATLSSFSEIWHHLDFDSFPILFFAVLRAWTGIFGLENDAALRALGFIIGAAVLAVTFANARTLGARWPVLSVAVLGLNPMFIRYGDSTRAYGLGILLILLTVRAFWLLISRPSPPSYRQVIMAGLLAIASVQCLYYNSVLLFAICVGAVAVALRERAWRTAAVVFGLGALAALSLAPYVIVMRRMQEWSFLVRYKISFAWLWRRVCEVLGSPDPLGVWLWIALVLGGVMLTIWSLFVPARSKSVLFAGVICIAAVPAYAVFLRALSYYTQPWYYITLAGLIACTLDVIFGAWRNGASSVILRGVRLFVAVAFVAMAALPAWQEMPTRHTNIDLVAHKLKSTATADDLILASHWQYGVSFSRYYHGPAELVTLPPVSDYRFHRYDLALRQMRAAEPLQPVYERIEHVLRSGHNVFLVGELPYPKSGTAPPTVSFGYYDGDGSWHQGNYDWIWPLMAAYFVHSHAVQGAPIPVSVPGRARIQDYEHLSLTVVRGWR